MGGHRLRFHKAGNAQRTFKAASVTGLAATVLSGAVPGTLITTIGLSADYPGLARIELRSAEPRVAIDGLNVVAGPTATDYNADNAFTVGLWIYAISGSARRAVDLEVAVAPLSTPLVLTVKSTGQQTIDLTEALSTVPDLNNVAVSVTGSVTLSAWNVDTCASGESRTYRKRELTYMLSAITSGAIVGSSAGTWALSWKIGAGNTGTTATLDVVFDVSNAPNLTWNYGVMTPPRQGGYALSQISSNSFAITAQSTANAFEIWQGRLVQKSTNGTATTYGSIAAVTLSAGSQYTITVQDQTTLTSYVITVNAIAGQRDIATTPAGVTGNTQLWYALVGSLAAGTQIVCEDGYFSDGQSIRPGAGARVNGASVDLPTADTWNDYSRWITVRSRNYLGAAISPAYTLTSELLGSQYIRFTNLAGTPAFTSNNTLKYQAWLMIDHCRFGGSLGLAATVNPTHHVFLTDNDIALPAGQNVNGISVYGQDCKVIGNRITNCAQDCIKIAMVDSVYGSGYSEISWNFAKNKNRFDGGTHPDFIQQNITSATLPYVTTGDYSLAIMIGNWMIRGASPQVGGVNTIDGQGHFCHDIPAAVNVLYRSAANVIVNSMGNGIQINNAKAGSFIRNLTMISPYGVSIPGGMTGKVRVEGNSAALAVKDSVLSAAAAVVDSPAAAPVFTNSIQNVDAALAATYFANSVTPGTSDLSLPEAIAAFTPIHADLTGASPPIGAVSTLIDHRNRTYDSSLMAAP